LTGIVGNVSIDLGNGDDTLVVAGVSLGGSLGIRMGDGDNIASVLSSTVAAIAYVGGDGEDSVVFSGTHLSVLGKVDLKLGPGANGVTLNPTGVRIGGDLVYTGGSGSDLVDGSSEELTIGGNVTFKGSSGLNLWNAGSEEFVVGKNFTFLSASNASGISGVSIVGSDRLHIGGNFSYVNPTGQQVLSLSSTGLVQINGSIAIKAAPTADMTANFGSGGLLTTGKINVVSNADHLTLNLSAEELAINGGIKATGVRGFVLNSAGLISGSVNIGAGVAGIGLTGTGGELMIAGTAKLKTVAAVGQNTATILTNVQFFGNFAADLSAGTNSVTIDNIVAMGTFTINAKSSVDTIAIETNDLIGTSTFYKAVTINLGASFDQLTVGANSPTQKVYAYSTFKILGGITDQDREAISLDNGNFFLITPTVS
jgi:hypothetical protein